MNIDYGGIDFKSNQIKRKLVDYMNEWHQITMLDFKYIYVL